MLCLSLKAGEYFVLGSAVVQYERLTGERVHLTVHAPREVSVLRGDVLERSGGKRPACVKPVSPRFVRQLPWSREKKEALLELREVLSRMGDGPEARLAREKLDFIFPRSQEDGDAARAV